MSTSQLIKQTLSPLAQHRSLQSSSHSTLAETNTVTTSPSMKNFSGNNNHSSVSAYQFSSSSHTAGTTNSAAIGKTNQSSSIDSNSSAHKSSPSRSISNHSSTLPSSIARNVLYQSESSYSVKNQQINYTSPGTTSVTSTSSVSQANNIYGTLPKSSSPFASNVTGVYGNVSAVANEFEQIIARNAASAGASNSAGAGNYNTLGSYRVQYSSTNPFLPSFNPHSIESNPIATDKINEEK